MTESSNIRQRSMCQNSTNGAPSFSLSSSQPPLCILLSVGACGDNTTKAAHRQPSGVYSYDVILSITQQLQYQDLYTSVISTSFFRSISVYRLLFTPTFYLNTGRVDASLEHSLTYRTCTTFRENLVVSI